MSTTTLAAVPAPVPSLTTEPFVPDQVIDSPLAELRIAFPSTPEQDDGRLDLTLHGTRAPGMPRELRVDQIPEAKLPVLCEDLVNFLRSNEHEEAARSHDRILQIIRLHGGCITAAGPLVASTGGTCAEREERSKVYWIRHNRDKEDETQALDWFHVEGMNSRVARDIASTLGVSVDEVLRSLNRENRSTTYRHRDYLVVQAEELARDPDDPTKIEFADLYALIGPHHLITISAGPSPAVERVRDEIQRKAVADEEIASSNYIFTRIFGSIIHRNVDVLNDLEEATRNLALKTASSGPHGNADRDRLARISVVAEQARHPVTATVEVLNALCEERNFFGSSKPRDAIERYRGYQRDMLSKLDFVRTQVEVIGRSWREQSLEESNDLLFKLAIATGALAVPGTLFDFLQVPFAHGWSDVQMWGAVAGSALISAGLLGYLFGRRALSRVFSRSD